MYNKLVHKEARLALVGLGYVGLPIALEFAKKISVIGFDINEERLTICLLYTSDDDAPGHRSL